MIEHMIEYPTTEAHIAAIRNALRGAEEIDAGWRCKRLKNTALRKSIWDADIDYGETVNYANVKGKGVVYQSADALFDIRTMKNLAACLFAYDPALEVHVHKSPDDRGRKSPEDLDARRRGHRQFVCIISLSRKLPGAYTVEEVDAIRDKVCQESSSEETALRKMHRKGFDLDIAGFDSSGCHVYRRPGGDTGMC